MQECVLYNVCDGATKRQMPFTLGWININFGFRTPISTSKWGYQRIKKGVNELKFGCININFGFRTPISTSKWGCQ
jgi:hypothetical protein